MRLVGQAHGCRHVGRRVAGGQLPLLSRDNIRDEAPAGYLTLDYAINDRLNVGADVRYGLPAGLTLTATVNPDFAQAAIDSRTRTMKLKMQGRMQGELKGELGPFEGVTLEQLKRDGYARYTATGASLRYRWFRDGIPLVDGARFSGATTANLSR